MDFLIVNGKVIKAADAVLNNWHNSDLFLVKQSVWFGYGGIPLLNENIDSLKHQAALLGYELPAFFKNRREMFRVCKRMLNKNKYFRSGLLCFRLFFSAETTEFIVLPEAREIFDFPLSTNGMLVDISRYQVLSDPKITPSEILRQNLWKSCRAGLNGTPFHSSVVLNETGKIAETIGANIFAVKNRVLITPARETGCYVGILRQLVIDLAIKMHLKVIESDQMVPDLLRNSDEIFVVSEARGLEWILGLENKRFVRDIAAELHLKLNQFLQKKAEI